MTKSTKGSSYLDLMAVDAKEVKKIMSKSKKANTPVNEPAVTLQNAMTTLPTNISVHKGIPVLRITSRGVWKNRVITLSSDKQAFFVTHAKMSNNVRAQAASSLPLPLYSVSKGLLVPRANGVI